MFKVGFLQCQINKQLPHMNMPLFVRDVKDLGCDVDCICVNVNKLEELIKYFKDQKFNLLAIDYMFPYSIINRIKRLSPRTKVVVGGNGFFDIFLKTEIDFGIIGAGRKSISMLVDALKNGKDISQIPNLFFKYKKNDINIIDYSGKDIDFNLKEELFPYVPYLEWKYIGFGNNRNEAVNRIGAPPAVIAEFGCPYRSGQLKSNCRNIDLGLSEYKVTNKAQIRLNKLFNERLSGGCAFCTYGAYFSVPVTQTNYYLICQMRYLQKEYDFDKFSIDSEYPFRFLINLINRIFEEKIRLKQINIRSRVDWLLKSEKTLIKALNLAVEHGFMIEIWQLGFESFNQKHLDLYNKKQLVEENLKAIKLLDNLEKKYRENFSNTISSHGMLGITPWTKIEDIVQESRILKRLPLHWRNSSLFKMMPLREYLTIYDKFLPIYEKIKTDGLLIRKNNSYDRFKIMDPDVRMIEILKNYFYRKTKNLTNHSVEIEKPRVFSEILIKLIRQIEKNKKNHMRFQRKDIILTIKELINCKIEKLNKANSYLSSGFIYEHNKKNNKAIEMYKRALRILPNNCYIYFALSRVYFSLKKYKYAIKKAIKAIELGYTEMGIHIIMGFFYKKTKKYRQAIEGFKKEEKVNPENPTVNFLLAECYKHIGQLRLFNKELEKGFHKLKSIRGQDAR